jgi:Lrp/AsnC family transcriptional regulator for asnA, asnC and gidA
MGEELGKDDLRILCELQKNAKIGYKQLSKITGIPPSTIHDRVKRFTETGIIKGYLTLLNEEALGYTHTAIIGVETGAQLYNQVANTLIQIEEVIEVYGTTAQYDLMIKIRTNSRSHLSEALNNIRNIQGVNDINIASILEVFKEEHILPLSTNPSKEY